MQDGRDHWWHELEDGVSDDPASCPCEPMDSEDLLFLMYTSGTTAKPKGIVHTTGGYLCGVATTHHYIFDLKPDDDVYWCAADIGWITGHSYIVYGPLCNQATSVLYEGTPDYPDKDRWWEIVERYKVTILYTAPTAIRSHMKWGHGYAAKHDLTSLRLLGSVGEPINPEAWIWYREWIGGDRTPIVDTWWQTETGMILITPLPGVTTLKPGSATKPFPGVDAGVFNERGEEVGPGGGGYLVLKRPWPAMLRGIFGDDARYRETYWSKYDDVYFAGDGARIDRDGDFWLLGRVDDVMNVSGHRISTIEVESALVDHHDVAEAAVCSRKDAITGEAIVAYVTLKSGRDGSVEKLEELRNHVAREDRSDREAREHRLHAGAAEDAQRQDHAPAAARRGREPPARGHDDARRPARSSRRSSTAPSRTAPATRLDSPVAVGTILGRMEPMESLETTGLMTIGRFSRLTGLTVKALRHYDELGLLRPAAVDRRHGLPLVLVGAGGGGGGDPDAAAARASARRHLVAAGDGRSRRRCGACSSTTSAARRTARRS